MDKGLIAASARDKPPCMEVPDMRWSLMIMLVGICLVVITTPAAAEAEYISAAKCKMCHKVAYQSWEGLAHAKAFDRLKPEEQSNPECLSCHATGGSADLPGVQCESCHGAGSEYKSIKVMKDREASVAAGLLLPDAATCKKCHEGAPHEVPAFDFEKAKAEGVHEMEKKGEEQE
jgi:nitrate/TMAO reductase-like tetraheme cytochrome c subunit